MTNYERCRLSITPSSSKDCPRCDKQVEAYLNGRLSGVGVALLVLMGVRLLNLLMLRLVQTSTSNALLARRHLTEAHGWLFTTRRAKVGRRSAVSQSS